MKRGWETEDERLLRHINIPPEKKLEWLREMQELTEALCASNKGYKEMLMRLREEKGARTTNSEPRDPR